MIDPPEELSESARLHVLGDLLGEGVDLGDAARRVYNPDPDAETRCRLDHARADVVAEMLARRGIEPPDGTFGETPSPEPHP